MPENLSPALAGLGLGIALAGAPGPVQAVLLTEALRGGATRGFRAMVGANLTLGVLLRVVTDAEKAQLRRLSGMLRRR